MRDLGQFQDTDLVFFPVPFISAILCAAISILVLRLDWGSRVASLLFCALFVQFGLVLCLVGLRFGYGYDQLILVQRMLPLLVGPLMFLGFVAFASQGETLKKRMVLHLGVAIAVMVVLAFLPARLDLLDGVIAASYVFYIAQLVALWRKGPDCLVHARLDVAQIVSHWMLRGAGLLLIVLVLDTAIALDFMLTGGRNASSLISFGSIPMIGLLLAMLVALPPMLSRSATKPSGPTGLAAERSAVLEGQVRELLQSTQLYLEPDLSVQRLARRLHVSERALSVAINQSQGMNVSQYVNRYRLEHAADLLRCTQDSVVKVMERSGFLTRSNFYREFQRHFGSSPAAYREN